MARVSFNFGRILLGLVLIAMGYIMLQDGHKLYDKYLHAFRKMILPNTLGSDKFFGTGISYE